MSLERSNHLHILNKDSIDLISVCSGMSLIKRLAQDTEGLTTLVVSGATLSLPLIASITVAAVPMIVSLLGFLPKSIRTLNSILSLYWKHTELNIQAPSQHHQRTDTFVPLHKYCCPLCNTVNWSLFTKWGEENLGCVE